MGQSGPIGERGGGELRRRFAQAGHAALDHHVLGLDQLGEVGRVQLDERLDEIVLVVMVEFEQVDQRAALLRHVGDGDAVGDIECTGVQRRVEHRVADALVDLAVQVVGERLVGERRVGFVDGNGLC